MNYSKLFMGYLVLANTSALLLFTSLNLLVYS
ncbi:hypothetical protein [Acinetobacter phage Ab65]|nr:hypothetical protein [Acinetobacter phage Ab65]